MTVFDQYAQNYDEGHVKAVAVSGFTPDYFHEYKLKEMVDYLKKEGLADKKLKLLDFGCGIGRCAKYIKKYLPKVSIYGIDVSKEEIRVAKKNNKNLKNITFAPFDGVNIPFKEKFDIIFVANVFHHIKRSNQEKVMKNISGKLTEDGYLFIFEHNPLNPMTQWIYYRNDFRFDKNAKLLSPFYTNNLLEQAGFMRNKVRYTIFFPRFFSPLLPLEKYLYKIPFGAHYYYISKK